MKIVAAAIRMPDGVHLMMPPERHHDIIHRLAEEGYPTPIRGKQGFVTDEGTFVDRAEAFKIALAAGQIPQERAAKRRHELYSEDLW